MAPTVYTSQQILQFFQTYVHRQVHTYITSNPPNREQYHALKLTRAHSNSLKTSSLKLTLTRTRALTRTHLLALLLALEHDEVGALEDLLATKLGFVRGRLATDTQVWRRKRK